MFNKYKKAYKIMLTKKQLFDIIDKIDEELAESILSQVELQDKNKEAGNKREYFKLYYLSHKEEYRKRKKKVLSEKES